MTEEERRQALMSIHAKPSLETRVEWIEADASAQRTAIFLLEKKLNALARVTGFFAACAGLALVMVLLS